LSVPSRDFSLLCAKSLFAPPPPPKKNTNLKKGIIFGVFKLNFKLRR
jgi:hypothetical protein